MTEDDRQLLLLVEDQAIIAMAEAEVLRRRGYAVETALTGEEAVEAATTNPRFDLVLMDINLGKGIDGTTAAERILETRELPIVFLTAYSDEETVRRVRDITRYGFVVKNSGDSVLVSSVEMALELFEAHRRVAIGERRLQRAQHLARLGSYELDARSGSTTWSPEVHELIGDAETRPSRDRILDAMPPDDRARAEDQVRQARSRGDAVFDSEYRIVRTDGATRWIHDRAEYWRDGDGKPVRVFGILQDVTERKEAELALEVRNAELDLALRAGRVILWTYDPETRTIDYGAPREPDVWTSTGLPGSIAELWEMIDPQERERVAAAADGLLAGNRDEFVVEYDVRAEDGAWRRVLSRGVAAAAPDGHRIVRGASLDITDYRSRPES